MSATKSQMAKKSTSASAKDSQPETVTARAGKKSVARFAGLSQAVRAAVESFDDEFMISTVVEYIEKKYPKMPKVGDRYGKHEIAHRLRQLIKKNQIEAIAVKRFERGRGAVVYRKRSV